MKLLVVIVFAISLPKVAFSYLQEDTGMFVNDFRKYVARAYTAIDNEAPIVARAYTAIDNEAPIGFRSARKNLPYHDFPSAVIVVTSIGSTTISAAQVQKTMRCVSDLY
jgi:hypothetical protein